MKLAKWSLLVISLFSILFLIGPKPKKLEIDPLSITLPHIETDVVDFVKKLEHDKNIRPGCGAEIIWANDTLQNETEFAIVYLHGFSASKFEGNPVHRTLAKQLEANLYLSRLHEHGLESKDPLLHMSAQGLFKSALSALAIGKKLGKKVIVIGTSTGGTLGLMLARYFPADIHSLILYSPNIEIADPTATLLNNNWGLQIARIVLGDDYRYITGKNKMYAKHWNMKYRIESLVELQNLLESQMTPDLFENIVTPVFMGYYYKDKSNQDQVVSVAAMHEMFSQLGSSVKVEKAFPEAGAHVITSPTTSKQWKDVITETNIFIQSLDQ